MIKRILIPIDFKEENKYVIRYGLKLAQTLGSEIIYLHPYSPTVPSTLLMAGPAGTMGMHSTSETPISAEEIEERKKDLFANLLSQMPEIVEVPHRFIHQAGMTSDIIEDQVEEMKVELILMSTTGALSIEKFFGTLEEKVTRISPCPVIVVPKEYRYRPLKKACLAIDIGSVIDESDLAVLLLLVKTFSLELDILHVQEKGEIPGALERGSLNKVMNLMKSNNCAYTLVTTLSDDAEKGVVEYIEDNPTDLLALIYKEHGLLERLFSPGLRKKMVSESDEPLLILK